MNLDLPRKPAFTSTRPVNKNWIGIKGQTADRILSLIGDGSIYCMAENGHLRSNYFLHRSESGATTFLKKIKEPDLDRQLNADKFAKYLISHGISASGILKGYPVYFGEKEWLIGYKYMDSRFAASNQEDIAAIASAVAAIHNAFVNLPCAREIAEKTTSRNDMLKNRATSLMNSNANCPRMLKLKEMLMNSIYVWDILKGSNMCQPLHGDLNYANIIFPLDGSGPVVLDFEDTVISWLPRAMDVAMALERFVLISDHDEEEKVDLAREFMEVYYSVSNSKLNIFLFPIERYLETLSIRSLITLAQMEAHHLEVEANEWEKFFELHDFASKNSLLLRHIQR